jgi:hypothetical protein
MTMSDAGAPASGVAVARCRLALLSGEDAEPFADPVEWEWRPPRAACFALLPGAADRDGWTPTPNSGARDGGCPPEEDGPAPGAASWRARSSGIAYS